MSTNSTAVAADTIPIPPNIVQLTGPVFLGHLFNWGLFGVLCVQVYIYYISFPKDRRLPKTLVSVVFILELLQVLLTTYDGFRDFGPGFGNMISLNQVGFMWFAAVILESIISAIGQIFYAWRVWILSKGYIVPGLITLLALVQCGAAFYAGVRARQLAFFSLVTHDDAVPTAVWLTGTAVCDVIIALSMMFYLLKSRTGFSNTNTVLTRIIRVTVETGLITAIFAILDITLFLAFPDVNYHIAPNLALAKLYSNSLLMVLNSRVQVVGGRNSQNDGTESGVHSSGNWSRQENHQLSRTNRGQISIAFKKEQIVSSGPGLGESELNMDYK